MFLSRLLIALTCKSGLIIPFKMSFSQGIRSHSCCQADDVLVPCTELPTRHPELYSRAYFLFMTSSKVRWPGDFPCSLRGNCHPIEYSQDSFRHLGGGPPQSNSLSRLRVDLSTAHEVAIHKKSIADFKFSTKLI